MPVLDQTRTVGLVTLPGAFVGVLLGGGDPVQAGVTQLVVLVALLAIEAVAVLVTVEVVARNLDWSRPCDAPGLDHTSPYEVDVHGVPANPARGDRCPRSEDVYPVLLIASPR